jgi:hypothetical protein
VKDHHARPRQADDVGRHLAERPGRRRSAAGGHHAGHDPRAPIRCHFRPAGNEEEQKCGPAVSLAGLLAKGWALHEDQVSRVPTSWSGVLFTLIGRLRKAPRFVVREMDPTRSAHCFRIDLYVKDGRFNTRCTVPSRVLDSRHDRLF